MFSSRSSVFVRFVGRFLHIFGKKAAPVKGAKASVRLIDATDARSPFDMAKLAQASSPFTTNHAVDRQVFDMSRLATEVKACATRCTDDCSTCSTTANESVAQQLTTELSDSETASGPLDARRTDDLHAGSNQASVETVIEMPGAKMSGDQQEAPMRVSARDNGLAARLKVVAAMNGPKALRVTRTIKRSSLARPAPVKLELAPRRMSSTAHVTWPAYTGRIAALSQRKSEALNLNSQIIALREKATLGHAASSGTGRATARAA